MSHQHPLRTPSRVVLGGFLAVMGVLHLTSGRKGFQIAVPDWMPGDKDTTVVISGLAELAVGVGVLSGRHQKAFGRLAALLFTAVFPGNIHQYENHLDAAPLLDTDEKRRNRLLLQPPLVWWALESTRQD